MDKKTLILIVGETGCGKDTVANKLSYPKVVSYKTGPMRDSDVEGVTHFFISDEEMDALEDKGGLIAWTRTGDVRYCATVDQLKEYISIYIINPDGVRWFKENYKGEDLNIIVIGLYLDLETRQSRCRLRSDFESTFENRVLAEQNDYDRFRLDGEFDYMIKNEDSNKTAFVIYSILNTEVSYRWGNKSAMVSISPLKGGC